MYQVGEGDRASDCSDLDPYIVRIKEAKDGTSVIKALNEAYKYNSTVNHKTNRMTHIELSNNGQCIEELIAHGSLKELALKLGVDTSTISKWRKRFGIDGRYIERRY